VFRYSTRLLPGEKKKKEDDSDMHLAKSIMQNRKYSAAGSIEEEYDYDGVAPSKKGKRSGDDGEVAERRGIMGRQMLTQKERCLFCFENPSRPKHLVVSIANFTYLMLPQWQPVASGHCIILPLQVSVEFGTQRAS
jgi:Protein similar to CwfJ C-terminus 1